MGALRYIKGQFRSLESVVVLFFVIMLIVLGVVVYFRYTFEDIKMRGERVSEQEAVVMLRSMLSRAEIACGNGNCIDMGKIWPFKTMILDNPVYYQAFFGYKIVKIEQLYPVKDSKECTISLYSQVEYPNNCGVWTIFESNKFVKGAGGFIISTPVSLYFPEIDEYRVGKMIIEVLK